ncbi:PQQ-binding-like beta-propeller repeat protein [Halogeometricum luteum]|uniref:PQQ-binding-like beta-propeller repeat protein n=1 Tax=Halogeometricum luteum TaxID=2950537 RepID=A0ABU2G626_9EURY|nr:PQQ-binding-like beta-propeller repeat protein [Halogeometricum sp. S3BR5-2]MDS0296246.1 PQQ-binding-like beta-propeller repeat protein [Halogeometricum sp. S3BR5-2]
MRTATVLVILAVAAALLGVVGYGLLGDGLGGEGFSATWTSDTGRDIAANHHAVAVGGGSVYAPISGEDRSGNCALVALDAADGSTLWSDGVPAANCTLHSVADPTLADVDGDGTTEVVATSTERVVLGFDAAGGEEEFRYDLSAYGYTKPVVADLAASPGRELVVVDVRGTAFVFSADGETLWTHEFGEEVWAQPAVADFDGDGRPELLAAGRSGGAVLFAGDGTVEWRSEVVTNDAITWGATGQTDGDPALEAVFSTVDGAVVAVDGASGEVEWRDSHDEFAAVHALGDGDGDGDAEVYVTTRDGRFRALDAAAGTEEWTTDVVTERVQMMPPPTLGEVDGDDGLELVVAGNDGGVTLLNAEDGSVAGSYARESPIYTHATLADADDDGRAEAFVMYGDGRVVRLDYGA